MDYSKYSYRVIWSSEDSSWVGLCAEFPSLSHLSNGRRDTLNGILDLVDHVVADMISEGETPPTPIFEKAYSGKFQECLQVYV